MISLRYCQRLFCAFENIALKLPTKVVVRALAKIFNKSLSLHSIFLPWQPRFHQLPILRMARETGSVLCPIAPWDCFWDAIASFIGYHEVAQETYSPIIQFD